MLSDMLGRGSFQRHTMTNGSKIARLTITAHCNGDCKFPTRKAATQIAKAQNAATVILMELSCILKVYAPGALRRCLGVHIQGTGDARQWLRFKAPPFTLEFESCAPRPITK